VLRMQQAEEDHRPFMLYSLYYNRRKKMNCFDFVIS